MSNQLKLIIKQRVYVASQLQDRIATCINYPNTNPDHKINPNTTGVARIFVWGAAPIFASVVHTFEAVAGSWGFVSAPAVSRVMGGASERKKNSKKYQ